MAKSVKQIRAALLHGIKCNCMDGSSLLIRGSPEELEFPSSNILELLRYHIVFIELFVSKVVNSSLLYRNHENNKNSDTAKKYSVFWKWFSLRTNLDLYKFSCKIIDRTAILKLLLTRFSNISKGINGGPNVSSVILSPFYKLHK